MRENLAARAVYLQCELNGLLMVGCRLTKAGKDEFMPAATNKMLEEEIGAWTGKTARVCLAYLGWSNSKSMDGPDLPPFWIHTDEYEPKEGDASLQMLLLWR